MTPIWVLFPQESFLVLQDAGTLGHDRRMGVKPSKKCYRIRLHAPQLAVFQNIFHGQLGLRPAGAVPDTDRQGMRVAAEHFCDVAVLHESESKAGRRLCVLAVPPLRA